MHSPAAPPVRIHIPLAAFVTASLAIAAAVLGATDAWAQAAFSRVSIATDGSLANSDSDGASISADGRYVAFSSSASNLVPNDTNGTRDIFVRDRLLNVTTRVSVTSAGEQRVGHSTAPEIGASGRFVVLISAAPLAGDDTQVCQAAPALPACEDIYVHDRETGATTRASVSSAGTQANGDSYEPHISSDGRFVVFESIATNLAAGGTPNVRHAFLRDRQNNTTIRLQGFNALPQQPGEPEPRISDDGSTVTFSGFVAPELLPLTPAGTPPACWHANACPTTYLYDTASGSTMMLSTFFPGVKSGDFLFADEAVHVSADGNHIILKQVMIASSGSPPPSDARYLTFKRPYSATLTGPWRSSGQLADIVGSSGDGRYHVWLGTAESSGPHTRVFHDHVASLDDTVTFAASNQSSLDPIEMSLSYDARFAAFMTRSPLESADTNGTIDVYVMDRDADGDGMPSGWETRFGLLPNDGTDAAGDPDGDGVGNLAEYQRGSHADKGFMRYLAEGAANAFFTTRLALVNPQTAPANVAVRLLGANQNRVTDLRTLPHFSRSTITFAGFDEARGSDFAIVVESDRPIVADRTMMWDARRYGSHAEMSIEAPSTTWYLAEGATHGNFDLFYLLLNVTPVDATATVKYLRPSPLPPIVRTYSVPANGRRTIWVDDQGPDLAETDVSAVITSDQPLIVERSMYASVGGVPFAAGHNGAGVTAPATTWFLAEGATGNFFDLYLLIANPNPAAVGVGITYLLPNGQTTTQSIEVAAESRKTITVDDQAPELANTPVSMVVGSVNINLPIVVERAMWWPSPNWYESHIAAGTTASGTIWGMADGEIGNAAGEAQETYILIANTAQVPGAASLTLLVEGGDPVLAQIPLDPHSRTTLAASQFFPAGANVRFGILVTTNVPTVVERAMYTTAGGVVWTAGTAVVASKVQLQ